MSLIPTSKPSQTLVCQKLPDANRACIVGINIMAGQLTCKAVAEAHGLAYVPASF